MFALCIAFLPDRLRHWFKLQPLLAAVAGPWIGMVLALAIDPPTTRTRKWLFIVGTAACILVYVVGRILNFTR